MPGLKGEPSEPKKMGNILGMMVAPEPLKKEKTPATAMPHGADPLYTETFEQKIGSTTKAKYEAGNIPRLHKELFLAIVKELNGKKKGDVNLTPILETIDTNRATSVKILSCLEAYGYLKISRQQNVRGHGRIFEILREMP